MGIDYGLHSVVTSVALFVVISISVSTWFNTADDGLEEHPILGAILITTSLLSILSVVLSLAYFCVAKDSMMIPVTRVPPGYAYAPLALSVLLSPFWLVIILIMTGVIDDSTDELSSTSGMYVVGVAWMVAIPLIFILGILIPISYRRAGINHIV